MRRILAKLFPLLCLALAAEASLWPLCDEYKVTNASELSAALEKVESRVLWEKIGNIADGKLPNARSKVDPVSAAEEKIDRLWAKTLLALRNKDQNRVKEAAALLKNIKETYPAVMPQRRSFSKLCMAYEALRHVLTPELRSELDNWLFLRAQAREPNINEQTAAFFNHCYKVFAGTAMKRPDLAKDGMRGLRTVFAALNSDGLLPAVEPGVAMSLMENVVLANESFADSPDDLLKSGELVRWAENLAKLKDTADLVPGHGWEGDAQFSPAVSFILAARRGLALRNIRELAFISPMTAVLYYAKARKAAGASHSPVLYAPSGSGWLIARTRLQKGPEARYLRLVTINGGRFADLLSLTYSGAGKTQMGRSFNKDDRDAVGRDYLTHTIASSTVTIDYSRQESGRAKVLRSESKPGLVFLDLDGAAAYKKMKDYRRTLLMTDDYLLDVFSLSSDQPFTAEWAMHTESQLQPDLTGTTAPEMSYEIKDVARSFLGAAYKEPAYRLLEDVSSQLAKAQWSCGFGNGLNTIMLGQSDTRVITGRDGGDIASTGEITHYRATEGSFAIARRENVKETKFAALHEVYASRPRIKSFARLEVGDNALVFEVVCGDYLDYLVLNDSQKPFEFNISSKKAISVKEAPYAFLRLHKESGVLLQNFNAELSEE